MTPAIWQSSAPVPVLTPPPKAERVATDAPHLSRVRSALAAIPNDTEPLDYDQWRNVIFAIHYATDGSDDGLALAHEFSARSPKYEPGFLDDRVWPYINSERGGPVITERTLFEMTKDWQDPEVMDAFDVVESQAEAKPKDPNRFAFVRAAEFSAGKPLGWIVKRVLPRGELVVLYGESGAGKSFMALDLLGAIARGVEWRGHKTTQGLRCGYIAAEGAAGFRLRLIAYAQHNNFPLADLDLAVLAGAPNFMEKKDILDLGHAMARYGRLDVLVVDTLAQVTAGANENSGEDMGRVIQHCKVLHEVTGATIVLVHHSGKDASRGARGWSGIKGALDAELEVTRLDNDRVLTVSKMKDGTGEGDMYGFRLSEVPLGMDEDGEIYGSCVVEHTGAPVRSTGKKPQGKHEMVVYKCVVDLVSPGENPSVDEVLTEYENRVLHDPTSKRDTRRQVASRALRALVEKGILEAFGARVGLPGGEG